MDWRQEYKRKTVSAEQAARLVQNGDKVVLVGRTDPQAIPQALGKRAGELRGVALKGEHNYADFSWVPQGSAEAFTIAGQQRNELVPSIFATEYKLYDEGLLPGRPLDVLIATVSPPDDQGNCSFGHYLVMKRQLARRARTVLVEVNSNVIRIPGDNRIHVSEIAAFVPHDTPPWTAPAPREPNDVVRAMAGYLKEIVRDGDTIEMGIGSVIDYLHILGVFQGKRDLGFHTGGTRYRFTDDVRAGIFTGARKTMHPGKVVASAFYATAQDLAYMHDNPLFEMYDNSYVNNMAVIAAHENMVGINSAVGIDLTGQITAESARGEGGGLVGFAMGSVMSRGGRSVIVLPATASKGTASRITPQLAAGQTVTVPRTFTDTVVTEFGVARLLGKSLKQRAEELLAVAHPDFRAELRREAQKLGFV